MRILWRFKTRMPLRSCQVQRYRQRISGPLLDRIDLHIEVPAVEYRDVASERAEESSTAIRGRIMRARERQQERFRNDPKVTCNARMATRHLKQHCRLNQDSQDLIRVAMNELNLSARAYDRILKVSRTIADLDEKTDISPEHVSEAIQYRTFDRTLWVLRLTCLIETRQDSLAQILNPIGMRGASHRKQQTSETMKPTISTTCNTSRHDSFDSAMGSRPVSPIANYNYHSVTFESFRANCGRTSVRSFWNITGDYLKNEARHDFLGEAALFAVVVVTAFLPLISNAHALMEFVRAIGNY